MTQITADIARGLTITPSFLVASLLCLLGGWPVAAEDLQLKQVGGSGTYAVPVAVNGAITLGFMIDTGASDVSVPMDVVSTLLRTGTVAASDFTGRSTYVLADGSKVPSLRFTLRQLRLGNHVISNVAASVAPAASQHPLLGQSFLSRLPPWTINYSRHVFVISDNSSKALASTPDLSAPSPEFDRATTIGDGAKPDWPPRPMVERGICRGRRRYPVYGHHRGLRRGSGRTDSLYWIALCMMEQF